jgi:hypothetical protein
MERAVLHIVGRLVRDPGTVNDMHKKGKCGETFPDLMVRKLARVKEFSPPRSVCTVLSCVPVKSDSLLDGVRT